MSLSNPDASMMSRYTKASQEELAPLTANNPAFKKYDEAFRKLDPASKSKVLSAIQSQKANGS